MIEYLLKIGNSYFYWYRGFVRFTKDISEAEVFDEMSDIEDLLSLEQYEGAQEEIKEKMEICDSPIEIVTIIQGLK